jgi:hypothetical protein
VPPTLWLEPAALTEVPATLTAYCSSSSSILMKASISRPSPIFSKTWVDGSGAASSPSHKRRWLTLLGGIIRVFFELETRWTPNIGIQV